MIADFRKGKQMYDKELQSFNLCSFVLIRVLSDKYYSVLLCGEFCSFPIKKVISLNKNHYLSVYVSHAIPTKKVASHKLH